MERQSFTLLLPPCLNRMYRAWRGRVVLSADGRAYKATAAFQARSQGVRAMVGPLVVRLRIYRPRRIGDIDGYLKGSFDSLNGIAWLDDSQVVELHAERWDDKGNPRLEVSVESAPEARMQWAEDPRPKRTLKALARSATYRRGR